MSSESDPVAARVPSKDMAWWIPNIDHKINPEVRHLLETYSNVSPDDVVSHVYNTREKAWAIRPYPCTGLGAFLEPSLPKHSAYPTILSRLKSGASLLDVGCYMGQDIRALVIDGAPQEHLYATDIVDHWQLGYEFFRDRDKMNVKYIESDILHPGDELAQLTGKIDVISVTHVLHQWDWDTQVTAAKKLCGFSRPGSVVVGYQGGTSDIEARTKWNLEHGQKEFSLHDPGTFKKMWDIVGKETGTEWETDAEIRPWEELAYLKTETAYLGDDFALLRFLVTRKK